MPLAINLAGDRVARWIIDHVVKAVSDEVIRVIAADAEKWQSGHGTKINEANGVLVSSGR